MESFEQRLLIVSKNTISIRFQRDKLLKSFIEFQGKLKSPRRSSWMIRRKPVCKLRRVTVSQSIYRWDTLLAEFKIIII